MHCRREQLRRTSPGRAAGCCDACAVDQSGGALAVQPTPQLAGVLRGASDPAASLGQPDGGAAAAAAAWRRVAAVVCEREGPHRLGRRFSGPGAGGAGRRLHGGAGVALLGPAEGPGRAATQPPPAAHCRELGRAVRNTSESHHSLLSSPFLRLLWALRLLTFRAFAPQAGRRGTAEQRGGGAARCAGRGAGDGVEPGVRSVMRAL